MMFGWNPVFSYRSKDSQLVSMPAVDSAIGVVTLVVNLQATTSSALLTPN